MALTKQDLSSITTIVREESKKIVQEETRKIVNGQSAVKSELLGEIGKVRTEMNKGFKSVDQKLIKLTKRVDTIGLQVANLEEDAPTVDEFDNLEKRVKKVEVKVASI